MAASKDPPLRRFRMHNRHGRTDDVEHIALKKECLSGVLSSAHLELTISSKAIVELLPKILVRPPDPVDVEFAVLAGISNREDAAHAFRHHFVYGFVIERIGAFE